MKVLVVGGGGREHAIIRSLKKNPEVTEIFACPGNGGIAADATCVAIGATDIEKIVEFAVANAIDYAVVAPDDPLVLGCVDALEEKGIPCFGPKANAAIIEGSKAFSKDLMKKYGIPTAAYEIFTDLPKALKYLETAPIPTVVKADGLALGKGVIIATPTGSTAYSLSAGGPIVHPGLECIIMTPICCHSLQHRPVVTASSLTITIELDERYNNTAQVDVDGRQALFLKAGQQLHITRAAKNARFIHIDPHDFFSTIRIKLAEWSH